MGLINQQKIISIWEGTITKIWDAIQFCRIIDNLFFWAQHCLKPKVTQYLSQWRLRYFPDIPKIYSLLESDTKTAEIIHQIQDRLSSLGLPPNEDLPALVRQAVVSQEVMRWSNKETNVDLTSKEDNVISEATMSSPSRSRDSRLEVTPSSATGSQQGTDQKVCPNKKEVLHVDSDNIASQNEKGIPESSKPHDIHIFQLKSALEDQKATFALPHEDKESASKNSTIWEDTKNELPSRSLLSPNHQALALYPATPSNVLTNEQTLDSGLPIISDADGKGNDKELFRQLQLKTSQKREDLDLSLKENSPPDKENISKLLPEKGSDKESKSDRMSFPSNPFVSETFELSFKVSPCLVNWDMYGPYPKPPIASVEEQMDDSRRIGSVNLDPSRANLAEQPIILEPLPPPAPPPLRVKIPWKGRNISVRLPPVDQRSVPSERNNVVFSSYWYI